MSNRPLLLDLFCGAGGAAMGYYRAGFDVVGVDIKPQPHYPFTFIQGDALDAMRRLLDGERIGKLGMAGHNWFGLKNISAVHASPPCQFGTGVQALGIARNGSYPEHVNLIPQTRELLEEAGLPYVIENVGGARRNLRSPIMLCGKYFGLHVYRHRYFECVPFLLMPAHIAHKDQTPSAGNGISQKGFISICGTGGVKGMKAHEIVEYWQWAIGIDWTDDRHELAEAIPPAYTEFIGRQLMEVIKHG